MACKVILQSRRSLELLLVLLGEVAGTLRWRLPITGARRGVFTGILSGAGSDPGKGMSEWRSRHRARLCRPAAGILGSGGLVREGGQKSLWFFDPETAAEPEKT